MNNLNISSDTKWYPNPPAKPCATQSLLSQSGLKLPEDYLAFFQLSNGGEGDLNIEPGWFSLWPAEEVLQLNSDYEVQKWVPRFFGFGSNGGGELLAFDITTLHPWKIYMIPFGDLGEDEAVLIAESFADFIKAIGQALPHRETD